MLGVESFILMLFIVFFYISLMLFLYVINHKILNTIIDLYLLLFIICISAFQIVKCSMLLYVRLVNVINEVKDEEKENEYTEPKISELILEIYNNESKMIKEIEDKTQ